MECAKLLRRVALQRRWSPGPALAKRRRPVPHEDKIHGWKIKLQRSPGDRQQGEEHPLLKDLQNLLQNGLSVQLDDKVVARRRGVRVDALMVRIGVEMQSWIPGVRTIGMVRLNSMQMCTQQWKCAYRQHQIPDDMDSCRAKVG